VGEVELVRTALNGVSKPWAMFVQAIVGRENLPSWEMIWDDFIQGETWRGYLHSSSSSVKEEEENVALSSKWRKGKPKTQGPTGPSKQQGKPKKKGEKYLSKVKFWCCQTMGHYAVTCPERKKKKTQNMASSAEVDDFSSRFDQDFAFKAEQSGSSVSPMMWYIESGASRHMTSVREQFIELRQQTHELDMVLGDN
jgi:hypothetical protein